MKFHLPPSLRKALLTCLAAVASISAPLASSLATGSFAVGLAGYAMIASEAQAEDSCYTLVEVEGSGYSGNAPTVTIDGVVYYVQITSPLGDGDEDYPDYTTTYYCTWSDDGTLSLSTSKPSGSYDFTTEVVLDENVRLNILNDNLFVTHSFIGLYRESGTHGGAIKAMSCPNGTVSGDFIRNTSDEEGGAVYISNCAYSTVSGHFIGNSSNLGGAIYCKACPNSTLSGDFIANSAGTHGGAIYFFSSSNCTINADFVCNSAGVSGGAIYFGDNYNESYSNNTISGDFIGNSAVWEGGAIYFSNISTYNTVIGNFIANTASFGGAIHFTGSANNTVTGDFTSNTASSGGAIHFFQSSDNTVSGDFTDNSADDYGGAIFITYMSTGNTVTGDFTGNSAGLLGGAIYLEYSDLTLLADSRDMTFTDNTALSGEAIYMADGSTVNMYAGDGFSITFNDTIVSNSSTDIINIGSESYTGTVNFNAAVNVAGTINLVAGELNVDQTLTTYALNTDSGTTLNINSSGNLHISSSLNNNGTIILNGGSLTTGYYLDSQDSSNDSYGSISGGTLMLNGGTLNLSDGVVNASVIDVTTLEINADTYLSLDINLSDGSADTITAKNITCSGDFSLIINDINWIDLSGTYDLSTTRIQLVSTDLATYLSLGNSLSPLYHDGTVYTIDYNNETGYLSFIGLASCDSYSFDDTANNAFAITTAEGNTSYVVFDGVMGDYGGDTTTYYIWVKDATTGAMSLELGTASNYDILAQSNANGNVHISATNINIEQNFIGLSGYDYGSAIYFGSSLISSTVSGDFIDNSAKYSGGAIYLRYNNYNTLTGNYIGNSAGSSGGAIYLDHSDSNSVSGSFLGNSAILWGGAIGFNTCYYCTASGDFIGNSAKYGGAVSISGSYSSTVAGDFMSNSAECGGALYVSVSHYSTVTGDFISNSATSYGGAIYYTNSSNGTVTGDFVGNSAEYGGAIYLTSGTSLTLLANSQNITFTDNTARLGEAIYMTGSSTLNMYAAADKSITFNDTIVSTNTSDVINIGSISYSGTVNFNAAVDVAGTINLLGGELNVDAELSTNALTLANATVLDITSAGSLVIDSSLSNSGFITGSGSITLNAATTNGGDISALSLSLTGSGNVFDALTNLSTLTLSGALTKGQTVLTATSLDNTDLAVYITSAQISALNLSAGDSLSLIELTADYEGTFSLYLDGLEVVGSSSIELNGVEISSKVINLDGIYYVLDVSETSLSLNVSEDDYWNTNANSSANNIVGDYILELNSISDYTGTEGGTVSLTVGSLTDTMDNGDYDVIKNTGDVSWDDFTFSDETWSNISALAANGQDVVLTTSNDGILGFTVKESEGLNWTTSSNEIAGANVVSNDTVLQDNGTELSSQDVFDSIDSTTVNEDVSITLHDYDTSENIIEIANLSGDEGKTMSITGDGIVADIVALTNTTTTMMAGTLDVSALTLRFTDEGDQKLAVDTIALTNAKLDLDEGNALDLSALKVNGESQLDGKLSIEELKIAENATLSGGTLILEDASAVSIDDSAILSDVTLMMADADGQLDLNAELLSDVTLRGSVGTIALSNAACSSIGAISTTGSNIDLGVVDTASSITLNEASSIADCSLSLSYDTQSVLDVIESGTSITVFTGEAVTMSKVVITISQENLVEDLDLDFSKIDETMNIELFVISDNEESSYENVSAVFEGDTFYAKFREVRFENGSIIIDVRSDIYDESTYTENGTAGALLLNDVVCNAKLSADSDLLMVLQSMDEVSYNGKNAKADALAAAISGATTTSLNAAQMGDMERNLLSLKNKNRLDQMVLKDEAGTQFVAWIAAEAGATDLNTAGTYAGAKLNNYGGTVGVEAQMSESFSFGAAISAMRGDLSSNAGLDRAEGDMDKLYISAYADYRSKSWTHSFVMSLGLTDASLDRTVSHDLGRYTTKGETDGTAFALGYEVGYDIALNEDKSAVLKPLFNATFVNSHMNGYTETGSDAALRVGEQENNYLSLGLGANYSGSFGESSLNRSAQFSLRALLKTDIGSRMSEADVTLVSNDGYTQRVKGNEPGAVGIELGAGLSIPVTESGSIFLNASVEMRSGLNTASGSAGYSFSF